MLKAKQANAKIAQQLQERLDENRRVSNQLVQLVNSVKAREAIYHSHMETSGGETNPAQQVTPHEKDWAWLGCCISRAIFPFRDKVES